MDGSTFYNVYFATFYQILFLATNEDVFLKNARKNELKKNGTKKDRKNDINDLLSRLESARFRLINEKLYTSTSEQAKILFQNDPHAFEIYHRGYNNQVGIIIRLNKNNNTTLINKNNTTLVY